MSVDSSSSESTTIFNSTDPKSTLISLNVSFITKLTPTNFLTWRIQILSLLEAHELHVFLADEDNTPPATITTASGAVQPNPNHAAWKRQDKLLFSSLLGSLSINVQPIVARATSAKEIWQILNRTYGNPSRGHLQAIRNALKTSTKGNLSVNEYMRGIITKADQLALLGSPLDHEDLLEVITKGLSDEYRAIVELVQGRDTPIQIDELHEKLISRENMLLTMATETHLPVTANAAQSRPQQQQNYGRGYSSSRGGRGGYGRGGSGRGYLGKCQICGIQGHSARRCPQYSSNTQQQSSHMPQYNSAASNGSFASSQRGNSPHWQAPHLPLPPPHWQHQAHHTTTQSHDTSPWLLDSGASHHIASDLNNLSLHTPYQGGEEVMIGNGAGLPITHTGSTRLSSPTHTLVLDNVLCVPEMKKNLISVNKLCKTNNVMVQLCPFDFQVKDLHSGEIIHKGKANAGVYEWPMEASSKSFSAFSAFSSLKASLLDWHVRLGHLNSQTLRQMLSKFSLPVSDSSSFICNSCSSNKSHKLPFATSSSFNTSRPLELLYTDVWTSPILSVDGYKYYVIFVDHFTKYTWFYPLKAKSQVTQVFTAFKELVENRFQAKITTLYSDNGGEFVALKQFLATHGISHLTTPPHTPEHNGMAERRHRHIVETGLSLLSHAGIPNTYWSYSFSTAVYLINRMITPTLHQSSPFHKLFQSEPNYSKLKAFGCLCYPWIRPYGHHKFSPKSTPCVFLGYSLSQSAFLCLDVAASRVYVSRHVLFHESVFPFSNLVSSSSSSSSQNIPLATSSGVSFTPTSYAPIFHRPSSTSASALHPSSVDTSLAPSSGSYTSDSVAVTTDAPPQASTSPLYSAPVSSPHVADQVTPPASPPTVVQPPIVINNHPMQTRAKDNIFKPNPKFGLTAVLQEIEPPNITQALKEEKWRKSMSSEYDAHGTYHTWDLVDRSLAKNIVGCKWIFRIKRRPDGTVERYKSRLVAQGFHQRPGIDFSETFSPVIKHATIRLVLGTAVGQNWPLRQIDVNNAFLQGYLTDEVYMNQPPGFIDRDRPDHVCRLRKAIYGLKQAPRAWYNELRQFLLHTGFVNSLADASLFVLCKNSTLVYVLIYVDDIVVTGNSQAAVSHILKLLSDRFSLKDLGDLSYFLGMEATRTDKGLLLTQTKYITDLLQRAHMHNAKPVATPMSSSQALTLTSGTPLPNPTEYRTIVGSLQYLGLTRPDIAFAVNRLSQYMHQPTTAHEEAMKRVLRYLAGTPTKGIFFSASTTFDLHAFSDADWAGNRDDYTSTGGYIVYLGKQPVSWSSKKQRGVARSSTEAEYRAVSVAASEVQWILSLMSELHIKSSTIPTIYCDNIGATYLCANPVFHSRMKHIALDYHFVRERVQSKVLRVAHVSSADQLADTLTKSLPRSQFTTLANKIGLSNRCPS